MPRQSAHAPSKVVRLADRRWGNDEIVSGLLEGDADAATALYDRFGNKVNRLVWRLLGADPEHDDVVQLVFVHILSSIGKLKKPSSLGDWIVSITVNTVRREIRSRGYKRLLFVSTDTPPERSLPAGAEEDQLLVRRVFAVLEEMSAEERIVFVLRFVEGHTLSEVAAAGGYSLATAKRRLAAARKSFLKRAANDPHLGSLLDGKDDE